MSSLVNSVAVYGLSGLLGTFAGAAVSAVLFLGGQRWLLRCPPQSRQRLLLALLACPALVGLALMVSMSMPTTLPASLFSDGNALAHCKSHPISHPALCQWHAPQILLPAWLTALVLLVFAGVVVAIVAGAIRMFAAGRRLRFMRRIARWQPRDRYLLLPLRQPLAFAAGLVRGRAFVSAGLRAQLDRHALNMVLAHEHAHIRHHDMLTAVIVNALAKMHLPWFGAAIRRQWELAIEQRCDETVVRQTGDRLVVADCLVEVARAQQTSPSRSPGVNACHLLDDNLSARVTALLAGPAAPRRMSALTLTALGVGSIAVVLMGGPYLHRLAELLLPFASL
ncbi:M56 family metallopeptidase [Salinisphaera sp. PC39]|uniref:M56 family metallopeptidase n=1 Tax=Salinisphaera sp. PC39 TaxID=1304156 RepID=UPI00333F72A5